MLKTRAEYLEESIKRPIAALEHFKNEYELGNFNRMFHPVIGNTNLFIKDILRSWDLKDMGSNCVVKYLYQTIIEPLANRSMRHQLFKQKDESPEEKFIRSASSINPRSRQLAQYCLNDEEGFLNTKNSNDIEVIAKKINQAYGPGTWNVEDMGANPIASQLYSLALSIDEKETDVEEVNISL